MQPTITITRDDLRRVLVERRRTLLREMQTKIRDVRAEAVGVSRQAPEPGDPSETGAHGQIVNVPLAPGTGGAEMRAAYEAKVFPQLEAFKPQLILISAGFDAHAADPLAELNWVEADYAWLTGRLCDIAEPRLLSRWSRSRRLKSLKSFFPPIWPQPTYV